MPDPAPTCILNNIKNNIVERLILPFNVFSKCPGRLHLQEVHKLAFAKDVKTELLRPPQLANRRLR